MATISDLFVHTSHTRRTSGRCIYRRAVKGTMNVGNINVVLVIFSLNFLSNGAKVTPELRCSEGEWKIFVVDKFLSRADVEMAVNLVDLHRPWLLNNDCGGGSGCLGLNESATWVSPIAPGVLEGSRAWRRLSKIVGQLAGRKYFICRAMLTKSSRMDFNQMKQDMEDSNGLTVRVFLNDDMKKNDYGEQVFFNGDQDGVMCGIHGVSGRAIIWNNTIRYITKPPSMLYNQQQLSIVLKLTDSEKHREKCHQWFQVNRKLLSESEPEDFPFSKDGSVRLQSVQSGAIDFDRHLTNKFFDSRGHVIAVFDDILTRQELDILREYLSKDYFSFNSQPYDVGAAEDNDNVAWISTQKVDVFAQTDLWQVVKQSVVYLSDWKEWYPYDVALNIIRSFDHSRIHEDCESHEYEFTFLLYLNPDWQPNYYGETVFFDQLNNTVEGGAEEYEMVAAVLPKYGRMVVFRNLIPHSARPPSVALKEPRYTFACKVSSTFRKATAKQLRETLEYNQEVQDDPEMIKLYNELLNGEHDERSQGTSDTFLESELKRQKKLLRENVMESLQDILKEMS